MATARAIDLPARLGRLLLDWAQAHPPPPGGPVHPAQAVGRPAFAQGTLTFRCGATARLIYPPGDLDRLRRVRRQARGRDCPDCRGLGHTMGWRLEVAAPGSGGWSWRDVVVTGVD